MSTRSRRAIGLINLAPNTAKPLSHQLADTLRRLIVDGVWIRDDKLPGSRTIADDARVSRNTVNAALEILISEGMLEARGRSGLYVTWKHAAARTQRVEAAAPVARHRPLSIDALPLDAFPIDVWKRLQGRYWSKASVSALETLAPAGAQSLREALAILVNVTAGISCHPDQVFVVSGLLDALALLKAVHPHPSHAVWTEDPTHEQVRLAVRLAGLAAVPIPVDSQGMVVDAAAQIHPATLAIVRPAFQFPTGAMLSPARGRELVDWAKKTGAIVLEDATESEFSYTKRAFRSLATLDPGSVVHFNSFSRTLFPALGFGYVIVPEKLAEACARVRRQAQSQLPLASQMVLADFIASGHFAKHVRKTLELASVRHGALLDNLAEFVPSLALDRQFGGLHICARLTAGESDRSLAERAAAAGLDLEQLSTTFAKRSGAQGLLLGFAGFDQPTIEQAVRSLSRLVGVPAHSEASLG